MIAFRLALATVFLATNLCAQVDQRGLAEQLLRGDRQAREQALVQARSLGRQNTGTELREALITLLDGNNRLIAEATSRKVSIASGAGQHVSNPTREFEKGQ